MIFCDLDLNNQPVWRGTPCLLGVPLETAPYQGFYGTLIFAPAPGVEGDPSYSGLGSDFVLLFWAEGATTPQEVPLQGIPSQQLSVVLDGQNCTLSFYDRPVPEDPFAPLYLVQWADLWATSYYQQENP